VAAHLRALLTGQRVAGVAPRITPELLQDPRGWDAFPVLTPRFKPLFGQGTRWPVGWGPKPEKYGDMLDAYYLRDEFIPLDQADGREVEEEIVSVA
jgi:hypothetical protein